MDLRIVLLPDNRSNKILKDYSRELNVSFDCRFELGKNAISHVTLIHAQIDGQEISEITNVLHSIAENYNQILVMFDYSKHEAKTNNYISIFFEDDKNILDLRGKLDEKIKRYILSKSDYKLPHATLTRLKNDSEVEHAFNQLLKSSAKFILLDRIALCEVGENGTCTKILLSYPLKF